MEALRRWGDRLYPIHHIIISQHYVDCLVEMNHMFAQQCLGNFCGQMKSQQNVPTSTSLRHKSKYIRQITVGLWDILPTQALVSISEKGTKN